MIYHLLPEAEPFSEFHGGALSRWTANILRGDKNYTIVCPSADSTWGFPPDRVWSIRGLRHFQWLQKVLRSEIGIESRLAVLRLFFAPLSERIRKGDVLYIHNRPEFALALGPACRRKGVRIVLHMQNSHLQRLPKRHQALLDVDALTFCSVFLRNEAEQYTHQTPVVTVIPNGADHTMFYPEGKPANPVPVILFASRLVRIKGPHIFLEAMRLLEKRGIRAKGIIVGSSNFGGSSTTGFIRELRRNAPQNVEFHDYCSGRALAEKFRTADIFCLPSVWNDPFPLTSIEAMASKLPVVASDSGGIPEAFAQGGALLVPPGSPVELSQAMERLISDESLREETAEHGYASFRKNFTWPAVREHYHRVLSSLPS
jgi:spore coat protein SA